MVSTKFPDNLTVNGREYFQILSSLKWNDPLGAYLRFLIIGQWQLNIIFFYITLKLCMKVWGWDIIAWELFGLNFFNVNILYQCFLCSVRLFFHLWVALCHMRKNVFENQHLSIDTSVWFLVISWLWWMPVRTMHLLPFSQSFNQSIC